ncbi:unnamed protein product [Danaus chrysippus]|uniref:(African queen) hypothetical protein n=1 Tax=Danaus chrysippus TaxID=151541 RepID=A0A8J2VTI3_9NEOP|nr:unnamed protein product [Danaus chrysippus]
MSDFIEKLSENVIYSVLFLFKCKIHSLVLESMKQTLNIVIKDKHLELKDSETIEEVYCMNIKENIYEEYSINHTDTYKPKGNDKNNELDRREHMKHEGNEKIFKEDLFHSYELQNTTPKKERKNCFINFETDQVSNKCLMEVRNSEDDHKNSYKNENAFIDEETYLKSMAENQILDDHKDKSNNLTDVYKYQREVKLDQGQTSIVHKNDLEVDIHLNELEKQTLLDDQEHENWLDEHEELREIEEQRVLDEIAEQRLLDEQEHERWLDEQEELREIEEQRVLDEIAEQRLLDEQEHERWLDEQEELREIEEQRVLDEIAEQRLLDEQEHERWLDEQEELREIEEQRVLDEIAEQRLLDEQEHERWLDEQEELREIEEQRVLDEIAEQRLLDEQEHERWLDEQEELREIEEQRVLDEIAEQRLLDEQEHERWLDEQEELREIEEQRVLDEIAEQRLLDDQEHERWLDEQEELREIEEQRVLDEIAEQRLLDEQEHERWLDEQEELREIEEQRVLDEIAEQRLLDEQEHERWLDEQEELREIEEQRVLDEIAEQRLLDEQEHERWLDEQEELREIEEQRVLDEIAEQRLLDEQEHERWLDEQEELREIEEQRVLDEIAEQRLLDEQEHERWLDEQEELREIEEQRVLDEIAEQRLLDEQEHERWLDEQEELREIEEQRVLDEIAEQRLLDEQEHERWLDEQEELREIEEQRVLDEIAEQRLLDEQEHERWLDEQEELREIEEQRVLDEIAEQRLLDEQEHERWLDEQEELREIEEQRVLDEIAEQRLLDEQEHERWLDEQEELREIEEQRVLDEIAEQRLLDDQEHERWLDEQEELRETGEKQCLDDTGKQNLFKQPVDENKQLTFSFGSSPKIGMNNNVHDMELSLSSIKRALRRDQIYNFQTTSVPIIEFNLQIEYLNLIQEDQEWFEDTPTLAYKVGKDMISLAEGMPNEAIFPFTKLELSTRSGGKIILEEAELAPALQYVPSQGLPALLKELREFQRVLHRPPSPYDVLVTNGGQHGIYQCVDMLVDPGDVIITTEYSYTGAFTALRPYDPEILAIREDDQGLNAEALDSILHERRTRGQNMPKVMYLIPTGNNPTGIVVSEERRRQIYELACKYDFLILEDDPYMFLNYTNTVFPSFLSLDACGRVLRLDSFSKVVSSGLRAGWVTAPAAFIHYLELHAQAELLHSCTLAQTILHRLLLNRSALASHLHSTRLFYEQRRNALTSAMREVSGLEWTEPSAGLFHWVKVPGIEDVYNMVFQTAFNRGLMLVPGQAFLFDNRAPCPYVRLAFSKIQMKDIEASVRLLADITEEERKLMLQKQPQRLATER